MVKKNFSNKKTKNKKIGIILLISVLILVLTYSFIFNFSVTTSDILVTSPSSSISMSGYIDDFFKFHTVQLDTGNPYFDVYVTERDFDNAQQNFLVPVDGIKLIINESTVEIIDVLKPNDGTVVIYPVFTSAAYHEHGFYTYYDGNCNESCITDLSFEDVEITYNSSGTTAQILHAVGYDFITDIDVDKNPEILKNYDTVILLHNEYVTKKEFSAIINHSNVIYLYPNALYAEISVNYEKNEITLVRGHGYPELGIDNGFDWEFDNTHPYEFDTDCLDWEFYDISNGKMLNCYPDVKMVSDVNLLKQIKNLLK